MSELNSYKAATLSVVTSRNVIWNVGSFVICLGITFITIPLFISFLGENNYGLFVLFQSVMFGFNLTGLGFGRATIKYVSESIGRDDHQEANRFINTNLSLNLLVGVIGAVALFLLAGLLAQRIFNISPQRQVIAQRCFNWVAVGWFINQLVVTLSGVPVAFQNFRVFAIGTISCTALIAGLGLGVLFAGGDLLNLVQANAVSLGISALVWWYSARIVFPAMRLRVGLDRNLLKRALRYGSWDSLASLGALMGQGLDKVIIGIFLPPAVLGYYNVAVTICSGAHAGLDRIGSVFFPLISHLQGKNDTEKIYSYFINGSWAVGLIAAAGYVPLVLFGKSFLALWVNPEFAEKTAPLFTIIVLAYMVISATIVRYHLLGGIGKVSWIAINSLLSGATEVISLLILVPEFGIMGAGWSYFVAAGSATFVTIWTKVKLFPAKRWGELLYAVYAPVVIGFIIIAASLMVHTGIAIINWLGLVLYVSITMLSMMVILLMVDFAVFRPQFRAVLIWRVLRASLTKDSG